MLGIIEFKDKCYYRAVWLYDSVKSITKSEPRNISDLLKLSYKSYNQKIEDCFGYLTDGYRKIYLHRNEIDEDELVPYLSDKSLSISYFFLSFGYGTESHHIDAVWEMFCAAGERAYVFEVVKEDGRLDLEYMWSPMEYADDAKEILIYPHNYTEADVDCKVSYKMFVGGINTGKIYGARDSYFTLLIWDEKTDEMELVINNMCLKIEPNMALVKHPKLQDMFLTTYYSLEARYKILKNNYYPEKS